MVQPPLVARVHAAVPCGLPRNARIWVDGQEQEVGEVIPVLGGKHDVRIDVGDVTVVKQSLETDAGDQIWELKTDKLVRR